MRLVELARDVELVHSAAHLVRARARVRVKVRARARVRVRVRFRVRVKARLRLRCTALLTSPAACARPIPWKG